MSANMIAAVIITVLSCACVVFFVILLSSGVLQKLKKEVFRYIKVYNKYMEGAGTREPDECAATETQNNPEEVQELPKEPAIPFIAKNVPTQKQDFFADYLKIRSAFSTSPVQVLREIQKQPSGEPETGACIKELLEKLSFETVYRISCLQSEQQVAVLDEVLSEEEKKVLEQYRATQSFAFSVTEFYSYLRGKCKELDDTVFFYTRNPESLGLQAKSEQLKICQDEKLCEGFQILQGNRLYDYGLRSSEITL